MPALPPTRSADRESSKANTSMSTSWLSSMQRSMTTSSTSLPSPSATIQDLVVDLGPSLSTRSSNAWSTTVYSSL
ncbi:hypothetical protein BHM03_00027181 [Ensete ventricosum]|nr:hypothetical protein BHM03_00027181 [Ensete ventricosum]